MRASSLCYSEGKPSDPLDRGLNDLERLRLDYVRSNLNRSGSLRPQSHGLRAFPHCNKVREAFMRRTVVPATPIVASLLAMADDEPVDQKNYLEEVCKPKCVKPLLDYQRCVKRIQDDDTGHKHCTGQYFDYWSCVDKCVAPILFAKLK